MIPTPDEIKTMTPAQRIVTLVVAVLLAIVILPFIIVASAWPDKDNPAPGMVQATAVVLEIAWVIFILTLIF